ncbi:hypothetical protein ZIOFF_020672 [Zingiber officinale]|uniref:Pentatricopeptide repeat-containing protein n=1 Tax=Zingiber officinale TaxID=94328 RepID=A0A8J5HAC6_ZINOF|nr:hypothetical protein ZIOFF_020672 [Zingiber officinale]
MCSKELMPNQSTFVGLLSGCAHSGLIVLSKQFHAQVIVRGFGFDEVVQVILVDMYAKCGDIESGRTVFDMSMVKRNVTIWNSLICGYGKHGRSLEALGVPDHTTFTCLLLACRHSGLADDGRRLSCSMRKRYGVPSREEHYSCMVDLFRRAGIVKEAYELIIRSACKLGPSVWGALLGASCSYSGLADDGRRLFCSMQECYGVPSREEHYSCMVDLFRRAGMVKEAYELIIRSACKLGPSACGVLLGAWKQWQTNDVRELMDDWNISKDTGHSWIEVGGMADWISFWISGSSKGEVHSLGLDGADGFGISIADWERHKVRSSFDIRPSSRLLHLTSASDSVPSEPISAPGEEQVHQMDPAEKDVRLPYVQTAGATVCDPEPWWG